MKNTKHPLLNALPFVVFSIFFNASCSGPMAAPSLPSLQSLGTNSRGYRLARVITHDHTPYSWDACDYSRTSEGSPISLTCLNDLRTALCKNHVDYAFFSDHPSNMDFHEIQDLLLTQTGDTVLYTSGAPTANQLATCSDGFVSTYTVGFENSAGLMALGMNQHLDPSQAVRDDLYNQQTLAVRNQLVSQADAIVVIPHTENETIARIETVQPDAIEIYNIHANVDPKIRMTSLNLNPFEAVARIATYAVDPYHQVNADFAFFSFFQIAPIYFQTWNQLINDNFHVTGLAGTDAHENIPGLADSTGERLDSHRRMMRFISNYVLTQSMSVDSMKTAIRNGQTSIVVEGISVPSGMDFYATGGATTTEIGQSLSLATTSGQVTFTAKMPSILGGIPKGATNPIIRVELHQVGSGNTDQIVASSTTGDVTYTTSQSGAFRMQIYIVPKHLKDYLGSLSFQADSEYPWVISNHIYVTP